MSKAAFDKIREGLDDALAFARGDESRAVKRLRVECGACGWTGTRKPGSLVQCPKCGGFAGFQALDSCRHVTVVNCHFKTDNEHSLFFGGHDLPPHHSDNPDKGSTG